MIKNSSIVSIAIIGTVVVAFTVAAFFLLEIERIAVFIWALAFLLLSEVALFGGLIGLRFASSQQENVFRTAGITSSLILYVVATFVITLFANAMRERMYAFILLHLGVIMLFAIATISILAFSRGIARRNEEDLAKVGDHQPKRGGF